MLLKSTIVALLLTVGSVIAQVPPAIHQGQFEDGTQVMWQCSAGMTGTMHVLIGTKGGQVYRADLACDTPTSKDI
jgi:hypothetical protein